MSNIKNPCEECIVKCVCVNNCQEFRKYHNLFEIKSIEDLQKIDIRTRIQTFIKWYIETEFYKQSLKNRNKENNK